MRAIICFTVVDELRADSVDEGAVRARAFAISQTAETTAGRDLERLRVAIARLPAEAESCAGADGRGVCCGMDRRAAGCAPHRFAGKLL